MNMINQRINSIVAALICLVAAYAMFVVVRDIGISYIGWLAFFDQSSDLYPMVITTAIALVPVSIISIAFCVFKNIRSYFLLLPVAHAILVFSSYAVYGMVVLLLIWWLYKYTVWST